MTFSKFVYTILVHRVRTCAQAAEAIVGRSGHDVRVGERQGDHSHRYETCKARYVRHQVRAHRIADLQHANCNSTVAILT